MSDNDIVEPGQDPDMPDTPETPDVPGAPASGAHADELISRGDGSFQLRSMERGTLTPPTGTYNFVRVQGDTARTRPLFVSAKMSHAQIASGQPVVYAGTASFERGSMAWWSNYSGTYQPIAEFRGQAALPDDKFVPWQKLQGGGTSMQRNMFQERLRAAPPEIRKPERPNAPPLVAASAAANATADSAATPKAPAFNAAPAGGAANTATAAAATANRSGAAQSGAAQSTAARPASVPTAPTSPRSANAASSGSGAAGATQARLAGAPARKTGAPALPGAPGPLWPRSRPG